MKKIIILILVVAVLVGGYCIYKKDKRGSEVPNQADAKINVEEVCRGALAYMTFPSGAEAEAFVAECIDDKHPEVIDRYKADLNLESGVEI